MCDKEAKHKDERLQEATCRSAATEGRCGVTRAWEMRLLEAHSTGCMVGAGPSQGRAGTLEEAGPLPGTPP